MLIFEMSNIYSLEMFVLRRRKDISLCPLPYLYEKKWSQWQMKDIEKNPNSNEKIQTAK